VIRVLAGAALAFLPAAAGPPPYGPPRQFSGIYNASFEHSEFEGCWLSFTPAASKRFYDAVPLHAYKEQRARIAFLGRSTPRLKTVHPGKGYGHLGMMPCEIEVISLRSVRALPPAR
jgi:hypothetical protein